MTTLRFLLSVLAISFSPVRASPAMNAPKCIDLYESYCKRLYSPENNGNLRLGSGETLVEVKDGEGPSGRLAILEAYDALDLEAIHRPEFPKDLLRNLGPYEKKRLELRKINQRFPQSMKNRVRVERLRIEANALWSKAIELTELERIEKALPGYHTQNPQERDPSTAPVVKRIEEGLETEVNRSIWENSPVFLRAARLLEEIKAELQLWIAGNRDLTPKERSRYSERIRDLKLVAPNTNPDLHEKRCETTKKQSFYSAAFNRIVICGGDLLTRSELVTTLSHEASHALGLNSMHGVWLQQSSAGALNRKLIEEVCTPKQELTCPKTWKDFEKSLASDLPEILNFEIPLRSFHQTLKNKNHTEKPIFDPITGKEVTEYSTLLDTIAEGSASASISEVADENEYSSLLTRLGEERYYTDKTGKVHRFRKENPSFGNPCALLVRPDPFQWMPGERVSLRVWFLAAYSCSKDAKDEYSRVLNASGEIQRILTSWNRAYFRSFREFATISKITRAGYGSDTGEKFADAVGMEIAARILKKKFPDGTTASETAASLENRRNWFFSSSSMFCSKPSITAEHPDWALAEKEISKEPHSEDVARRREILLPSVADALGCRID